MLGQPRTTQGRARKVASDEGALRGDIVRLASRFGRYGYRRVTDMLRPRVRGVEERFESRVLPLFARRTKELGALLPELYLHGLAEGDFELAMRGLLGEGAPLSKSSMASETAGGMDGGVRGMEPASPGGP